VTTNCTIKQSLNEERHKTSASSS